jgi:hypothetical protein
MSMQDLTVNMTCECCLFPWNTPKELIFCHVDEHIHLVSSLGTQIKMSSITSSGTICMLRGRVRYVSYVDTKPTESYI